MIVASRAKVGVVVLGLVGGAAAFACGRVEGNPSDAGAETSAADGANGNPSGDASSSQGDDGATVDSAVAPYDAGVPPDAGPPPVVACVTDGGVECPVPPSQCLDDDWLRYYSNGTCGDAGMCTFTTHLMKCVPSPVVPACLDGGCRLTVIR